MNNDYLNWIKQIYENEEFVHFMESNETHCSLISNTNKFWNSYDISKLKYNNVNLFVDISNGILKDPHIANIQAIIGKFYEQQYY